MRGDESAGGAVAMVESSTTAPDLDGNDNDGIGCES
jgi:hypothetical protein